MNKFRQMANKQFGEGTIYNIEEGFKVEVFPIPTGIPSFDYASGIGGFPMGRIIELYGENSSGKTTLALKAIAQAQQLAKLKGNPMSGKKVLFIDAEHAVDFLHSERLGVINSEVEWNQPDSGEQVFDLIDIAAESGEIGMIVVDSVSAMASSKELEESMDYNPIGLQARLMSQGLRKVNGPISKSGMLVIFINQTRSKMTMYGELFAV
jgi:recombination protein RecA